MKPLHKGCQGFRSHLAADTDQSESKALTGFLSSIKLSFRGFPLDCKIFRSISVSLMRSSVDTSSKRGMVKEKETAVVTKDIIPIPWNVLRQSKILELWLALSATWYLFS